MKPLYWLTMRRKSSLTGAYGPQVTLFSEAAPSKVFAELRKVGGLCVAYGREGERATRDTHPDEPWDQDAGGAGSGGAL